MMNRPDIYGSEPNAYHLRSVVSNTLAVEDSPVMDRRRLAGMDIQEQLASR
jgi:hypothetical protein